MVCHVAPVQVQLGPTELDGGQLDRGSGALGPALVEPAAAVLGVARRGPHSAGNLALRLHEREARRDLSYATGLTFAFDIPLAGDPVAALGEMVAMARAFGDALAGDLVDDERRPLGESGLAAIERSLQAVVQRMQAHGIPAGGALARRLFA